MKSAATDKRCGVIVPMVTPLTSDGLLDEPAVGRLVEFLHEGGVHGVFVLGTTGEAVSVPLAVRSRLVELVADLARERLLVYAGISGNSLRDCVDAGNLYLKEGIDAVVAHVPAYFEAHPEQSLQFFTDLAGQLSGRLILYNMPLTTNVSLPIDVCRKIAEFPGVIGIKDSENNAGRQDELLRELGDLPSFSIFVGTGSLMAKGLLLGADGIVPSVGNLVPGLCRQLYDCATTGDPERTRVVHRRIMEVSNLYQNGRSLGHSLAALKGAMSWLGLCGPDVFPPLKQVSESERAALRKELIRLGVDAPDFTIHEEKTNHRVDDGRSGGRRTRALPADPR